MTTSSDTQTRQALVAILLLTAATTAAIVIADGWVSGLAGLAALLAFTALVYYGRHRNEALEILSGIGDERTRSLYRRASVIAGHVMVYVLVGWWLVSLAAGHVNATVNLLCAIAGVVFLAAVAWVRWRD